MYVFLSEEWIKAYGDEWNKNERLLNDLKRFSARIKYLVEGNEAKDGVYIKVENGKVVETGKADEGNYDFVLRATLDNWKKLATGDMGPRAAMLTKRLKFKGSMIKAMKYMSAFEESLRLMGKIPTHWNK